MRYLVGLLWWWGGVCLYTARNPLVLQAARKTTINVGFRKPVNPHGRPQRRLLSLGTESVDMAKTQAEGEEAVLAL